MIGYIILGLAFVALLFGLPLIAQTGLSDAEMDSAVISYGLNADAPLEGDLVDLPYHLLQQLSITTFGLTAYSIKLPSIIIGLLLGLLFILLLNRWFKNNVSLLASCVMILSTPFLFLAGSGTPLIMLVFWPTLLLWLGSKIHGETRPQPSYSFFFAVAMLLSIFTPYMIYFAIFCVIFVALQPHLRFIVKNLPKPMLALAGLIIIGGFALLITNFINQPGTIKEILFAKDFDGGSFWNNTWTGLTPVFSWRGQTDGMFLAPLMSLPLFALALIGLFSTTKGFFASRNSIATLLLVFTIIVTGFNPEAIIFFMLPITILVAHGLKYLLEKWYGLFPENPYARISALVPLTILFGIMIIPSLLQYLYGYRYNPQIANKFYYDLSIIDENLTDEVLIVNEHYDFYKILEFSTDLTVLPDAFLDSEDRVAVLHNHLPLSEKYSLSRIITSSMRENSDIIYLYTVKGE
jgi:hypothetical protein